MGGGEGTGAAAVEMEMGPLHRASRTDLRAQELLKASLYLIPDPQSQPVCPALCPLIATSVPTA